MSRFTGLAVGLIVLSAVAVAAMIRPDADARAIASEQSARAPDDPESTIEVDYSKLRILLQRSACFGDCPDYMVSISGDGQVVFTTDYQPASPVAEVHREFSPVSGVMVPGTHRTSIDRSLVRALVQQFRAAQFFNLANEYRHSITDSPTYIVAIDTGTKSKRIVDYVGKEVGMPAAVTALEDAIDKAAGTSRWIEGTPDVIPLLLAEGFDFSSLIGLGLMTKAAERGDVATMDRLLSLGAPLAGNGGWGPLIAAAAANRMDSLSWLLRHGAGDSPKAGLAALTAAVQFDSELAFDRLRDLVGQQSITRAMATDLLRKAAANGNVRMVEFFLQLEPYLNGPVNSRPYEDPPLWAAAHNSCQEQGSHPNCDHRKVVRMLLDAGSDPRWDHPIYRSSVLFGIDDVEIANMLLARGADPNFKDSEGEPIIFSIHDEDVALAMIAKGLNLKSVRPADKMTLRGWATIEEWPRVTALLEKAGLRKSHKR